MGYVIDYSSKKKIDVEVMKTKDAYLIRNLVLA